MLKKKQTKLTGDIFASLSPSDVYAEKKPLAREFFTAQEDARNIVYYPDIIFRPKEPYNAFGIVCEKFRCNVNLDTPFGNRFAAALNQAFKTEEALEIRYSDQFPKLLFTVHINPDSGMTYHETPWGWTCHRT